MNRPPLSPSQSHGKGSATEQARARPLRAVVVEDDPVTAQVHAHYVRRMPGFELTGVAANRKEAVALLLPGTERGKNPGSPADVVLLDMNLPDGHGLALCRMLRAAGAGVDVIALTAATELDVVREAIALGVVQYLIKPFSFAAFQEKLTAYARYRHALEVGGGVTDQRALDEALTQLHGAGPGRERGADDVGIESTADGIAEAQLLPKGLSAATLDHVIALLTQSTDALSATEVHEGVGVSRVTARRYLEYLAASGRVDREPRYGSPGRPEMGYRWHE